MKFYDFNQNNSGGYFIYNEEFGVGEVMIIEAENYEMANAKLNMIGDEVDGFHSYCSCCGERWSEKYDESDAEDFPHIYSNNLEKSELPSWCKAIYIHYANGAFKKYEKGE